MDLDGYRRRLQQLADDRSALFGAPYRDNPADAQVEQRQQLLAGTDRLDRSTQRLKHSQALAAETEAVGASTLADLERQRNIIEHTSDVLLESEGYVDRSIKTLRGMARRYCDRMTPSPVEAHLVSQANHCELRMATNRVITISIITILVLLIIAVIFSKFR